MRDETAKKLEAARLSIMEDISEYAKSLFKKGKTDDFPDTIQLNLDYDSIPSLKSYPYIKIENNEVVLVYINEDYQNEYDWDPLLDAYKTGELEMDLDTLDVCSTDELYEICQYLEEKLRNE